MLIRPVLFKTSGCPSKSDYIRYVEDDMLLEGKIAELIFKLNPKLYQKYIWENKRNKPIVYVKLKRLFMVPYKHQAIVGHSIGLGIQIEPVVHSQQENQWQTMYNHLAGG